jgi:hypothetical protein
VYDVSSVRILDWGDASVGHPFGTMLATLNSIAFHAGVQPGNRPMDDARVLRIRDAYLEPFTGLGNRAELVRWVALARSTGCVTHAISWEKALQDAPEHGHGRGVPSSRMVAGATRAVGADFGNAASTPGLSRARGSLRRGR